jgi:hypothetical protein
VHVVVGIVGAALVALMLIEVFTAFLLPRRVKRDPRIARGVLRTIWRPWRWAATKLSDASADAVLGIFGPIGLLVIIGVASAGVILGDAAIYWANAGHLGVLQHPDFGDYLYFSAGAFVSASAPFTPVTGLGKAVQIFEAATGLAVLGISIGYLPALFQAFSRRETAVSRLDPRAGSPPTVAALLERSSLRGGWRDLDEYLREWETWTAELMETHLSYPILGYYRSQHVRQNWLAALVTVVDACAYAMAYGPEDAIEAPEITFRIGRHALSDLSLAYNRRTTVDHRDLRGRNRLTPEMLQELRARLENSGLHSEGREGSEQQLNELRASYEPYAVAISDWLRLALPDWLSEDVRKYWQLTHRHRTS